MSCRIVKVASDREDVMLAVAGLDPFQVNQLAGEELRSVLLDLVVRIHGEHTEGPRRRPAATEGKTEWQIMEVIECVSTGLEKGSHVVRPPERPKDINERLVGIPRKIRLGDEHGDTRRQPIVSPYLQDVTDQSWLIVQVAPLHLAGLERIMLEGNECHVSQAAVSLQVLKKASQPRGSALRIRPYLDILVYALENGSAQFQCWVNAV